MASEFLTLLVEVSRCNFCDHGTTFLVLCFLLFPSSWRSASSVFDVNVIRHLLKAEDTEILCSTLVREIPKSINRCLQSHQLCIFPSFNAPYKVSLLRSETYATVRTVQAFVQDMACHVTKSRITGGCRPLTRPPLAYYPHLYSYYSRILYLYSLSSLSTHKKLL